VAEAGTSLGPDAENELLRAAQLAAIHLIAHRASDDVKRRTRGAFVRELLDGRVPSGAPGAPFALRTQGPFTVLAFAPAAGERLGSDVGPDRVLSIVSLYCEDAHREAMCALVDERFWALLPTPQTDPRERLVALATRIAERVERALHIQLVAGIGSSVSGVADVPRSRRAAEHAIRVMRRRSTAGAVVHIDDVAAHAVLMELLDLLTEHPHLHEGKLDQLIAHDGRRGTHYVDTLRAYLDCRGDAATSAARLGVHANTMRYRLRRAVALSGLDLDDPDERLITELQLRLHADATAPRADAAADRPARSSA
jgi:hypothetical protein